MRPAFHSSCKDQEGRSLHSDQSRKDPWHRVPIIVAIRWCTEHQEAFGKESERVRKAFWSKLANLCYYCFNFLSVCIDNSCMCYKIQKLQTCIKNETFSSSLHPPAVSFCPQSQLIVPVSYNFFRDILYYTHNYVYTFSFCHNSILYTVLIFFLT